MRLHIRSRKLHSFGKTFNIHTTHGPVGEKQKRKRRSKDKSKEGKNAAARHSMSSSASSSMATGRRRSASAQDVPTGWPDQYMDIIKKNPDHAQDGDDPLKGVYVYYKGRESGFSKRGRAAGSEINVDFGSKGKSVKVDPTRVEVAFNLAEAQAKDLRQVVELKDKKLEELQEKVQTLQKKVAQQEVAGERMMADHNGKFHAVKAKLEGYALAQGKDIPMTESPLRSWPACKKQVRDEIDE